VTFSGTDTGELQLDTLSFGGLVAGFSTGDQIDLAGMAFNSGSMSVHFREARNHRSGTLTISNGSTSINLTLMGQYTAGTFQVTSDGLGGTLITETTTGAHAAVVAANTTGH